MGLGLHWGSHPKAASDPQLFPMALPCVPALRASEQGEERLPAALAHVLCLGEG